PARYSPLPLFPSRRSSDLVLQILIWDTNATPLYSGMVLFDPFAIAFSILCIVITALIFLLSKDYFDNRSPHASEYYALFLFSLRSEEHTSELQSREHIVCR